MVLLCANALIRKPTYELSNFCVLTPARPWAKIWPVKSIFKAGWPKLLSVLRMVILVLFIHCCCSQCLWGLSVGSLFCGEVLGVLSSLAIFFLEEERVGCFTLIVLWLSVFSLSHGPVNCSTVCDYDISWTYCKSGNFCENFIFRNSVTRHIWDIKNSQLGHDLPKSVIDRMISPFHEDFIFTQLRIC